mgnify:FL=1
MSKLGAPVKAAQSGKVVYVGTGLKGYGLLVILKHDEEYLSAYGYAQKCLVKQGQFVKKGQNIAEVGLGPAKKAMVRFEVRQSGKYVDPKTLIKI